MTRFKLLLIGGFGLLFLGANAFFHPAPRLIWNASPSVPIGLYRLAPPKTLTRGELVVAQTPAQYAQLFATRDYLPIGVPLLKYIAALSGQKVCRIRLRITIDGKDVANARRFDHKGRALPKWHGCVKLTRDQVFLLNPNIRDSLDGRYFGAVARQSIIGRAVPLMTSSTHMLVPRLPAQARSPHSSQPPNQPQGATL